ncbi:RNA methyltransferase, partial [Actinomycetaceae bacterium Sa1BUA1]|nr:RNA methyltransferase [Oceanitalea stevensii]
LPADSRIPPPTGVPAPSLPADSRISPATGVPDPALAADSRISPATGVPAMPDLRRPTAWLFGNEAHGLRPEERELADAVVGVPIHGLAESLNVATAATLCLYASARAQRR